MASENQKLIAQVKLGLTERIRQFKVRARQARHERERLRAELELLIDDFVQEGHDLRRPEHRELLYEVIARKFATEEEEDYGKDLTF